MPFPRAATPELLGRIERVCRMRIAAEAIPSDQQLADESGVSRRLVRHWMGVIRKAMVAGGQPGIDVGIGAVFHVEQAGSRR